MVLGAGGAVDWWARGLGGVGVLSLLWNIYTWRRTSHLSVKAWTSYQPGPGPGQTATLRVSLHSRCARPVRVEGVERQRSWRSGRRWSRWQTEQESNIEWSQWGSGEPVVPFELPAYDRHEVSGIDRVLAGLVPLPPGSGERWRFRVVLVGGDRFVARREQLKPNGKPRRWAWHAWTHSRLRL